MNSDLIMLGAGGHAKVLRSLAKRANLSIVGFVSEAAMAAFDDLPSLDLPRLGNDAWLAAQSPGKYRLINGVGSVGSSSARRELFNRFSSAGFDFPVLVDPNSDVDADVQLGIGTQVLRGAVIQPGSRIGKNCILNTGVIVDHDCDIGDHVHIAPGCTLSGNVSIGAGTHIGTAAVVRQGIRVGANCLIGAGSVVVRDIPDGKAAWGIPAVCR